MRNIVIEIMGTEKLELPIMNAGQLYVTEGYLKILVSGSNKNLEEGWRKIEKLRKLV